MSNFVPIQKKYYKDDGVTCGTYARKQIGIVGFKKVRNNERY